MNKTFLKKYIKYFDLYTALLNLNVVIEDGVICCIDEADENDISSILNIVSLIIDEKVEIEGFEDDEEKRNWLFDILKMIENTLSIRLEEKDDKITNFIDELKSKIKFTTYNIGESDLFPDQKEMYLSLKDITSKKESAILSAPTSFGKTYLLRKTICELGPGNYFFIVPTIALQNEYFIEFQKIKKSASEFVGIDVIDNHKFNNFQKNIFILTQEKMLAFIRSINKNASQIKIDYLIFDEFQEFLLEPFSIRGFTMYSTMQYCQDFNIPCIFSLPLIGNPKSKIDNLVKGFNIKNENVLVTKINYAVKDFFRLANNKIYINDDSKSFAELKNVGNIDELINNLIINFKDQTNIIFTSKSNVKRRDFNSLPEFTLTDEVKLTLNYIQNNLAKEHYYVYTALYHGIGVHHAEIDFYLKKQIEYLYKNHIIHTIFANESLAHGVNLKATNLIFESNVDSRVHKMKSKKELTYKNLIGRVGRLRDPRGRVFLNKVDDLQKGNKEIILIDEQINKDIEDNIAKLKTEITGHELKSQENSVIKLTSNFTVFPFDDSILIESNYDVNMISSIKDNKLIYDSSPINVEVFADINNWITDKKSEIKKIVNNTDENFEYLDEFCNKIWDLFGKHYFSKGERKEFISTLKAKFFKAKVIDEVSKRVKNCRNNLFWMSNHKEYRDLQFNEPDEKYIEYCKKYDVSSDEGYAVLVDYIVYKRRKYIDYGYMIFVSNLAYFFEDLTKEKLFEDNYTTIKDTLTSIGLDSELSLKVIEYMEKSKKIESIGVLTSYNDLMAIIDDDELKWIIKTCFE
jgi:hypothetical protein